MLHNRRSQDTADDEMEVKSWEDTHLEASTEKSPPKTFLLQLSSLIDDLLGQITQLKEDNKTLQAALKQSQEDTTLKDRLNDLERKLANLEKQQNQDAQLLKNVVHMDALRGLVFWQSLGTAITGIDCMAAYAKATDTRVSPHETTTRDTGGGRTERKLVERLPEEYIRCPDPDLLSTLRKLGFVASGYDNVLERIDRLEELMALKLTRDDLEALGFSPALLKRIDDLEAMSKELQKEREKLSTNSKQMPVPMKTEASLPLIAHVVPSDKRPPREYRKNEDLNDNIVNNKPIEKQIPAASGADSVLFAEGGFQENKKLIKNLQENLNTLREQIARIAGLTSDLQTETKEIRVDCKNKKLIKNLQENLNTLREQIARIAGLTSDLQTETKEIRVDCKDLHQLIKDLDTRKADYDYVDAQLLK
ncbi:hypothetical protein X801_05954, partial [Opisthorchis viverrini]